MRSIYARNCLHHNRGGRPGEIELRIVSTDISSTACEDRTKVILSTRESSSSCHESRTIDTSDTASSSGRSSCRDNDPGESQDNGERETFYDMWQADDSSAGRSDDGYSESTPRFDSYTENHCVSGYISNKNSSKGQRSHSESIDARTVENDGRARGGWAGNKGDVRSAERLAETRARKVDENGTMSNEDLSNLIHKDVDSIGCNDEYRMRGGCGGRCCRAPRESIRRRSSRDQGCCCRGLTPDPNESFGAPGTDARMTCSSCTACTVRCCCRCPRVCKKAVRCCEASSCATGARSCGGGGYCGGGRCGGCGKPGQICTPSSRSCSSPAHSSGGRSPCVSRPRCPPRSPCPTGGCRGCCSRTYDCGRSRSPGCQSIGNGCCINERTKCGTDAGCRLKLPCECLGGGLDCRRCGRKVYQAEMQIVSGVPYHSTCFSCFCCRKPLEPLTYQENCGEIYCKR
ncbi:Cysteine and glycine-rich protein [Ooceraea biroi]|uniref:Cysteine and glycine-rich protein n=1 Tax=Ooceraea biroi TaxID=2015173 RepID=A0A026X1Z4_OOCBI|nr:Cysteine and glycine-rich protein [Ooceraea biroi]